MLSKLYARWMFAWETALTTRDTNRIVRPVEWGFDWLNGFAESESLIPAFAGSAVGAAAGRGNAPSGLLDAATGYSGPAGHPSALLEPALHEPALHEMEQLNQQIVSRSDEFFGYQTPTDFRLEERHPQLFPTNVRPETLAQDARLKSDAAEGKLKTARFLRFTSPVRTIYPENDQVNARWYPAPAHKQKGKPKQAIIVMPQWNADAFSHNALCEIFNRFGVSALRLSKPFHDIRRPLELERSDYACSSNVGRTIASCRQAVVDIRSCIDWLQTQGYEQFGVLGTSLGSCYAFIAAAHDPRIRVCAFNHVSTWFGDAVWTGQSTRHIREAFEQQGMTQDDLRRMWLGISPMSYMRKFAANPKKSLVVYAPYDLTFRKEFSLQVLKNFDQQGIDYEARVLPCGHYTTGETPYKYIDGWYLGSFVYRAFKQLQHG